MAPDRGAAEQIQASSTTSDDKKSMTSRRRPKLVRLRGKRGSGITRKLASSKKQGAQVISKFHALEKRLSQTTDPAMRRKLEREKEGLGGLQAYQEWSVKGGDRQRGGETGKWLVKALFELEGKRDFKILDVGAIGGTAYSRYPWIKATSIDLHPAPDTPVIAADFFAYPPPLSDSAFDVVCLSLVVNFVGDIRKRAEMLRRPHLFLPPNGQGYLFVVLPLACLSNSRYMDHARFRDILGTLGWEEVRQHDSALLTHWLLKPVDRGAKERHRRWKREEVRPGAHRNNFCIVVQ